MNKCTIGPCLFFWLILSGNALETTFLTEKMTPQVIKAVFKVSIDVELLGKKLHVKEMVRSERSGVCTFWVTETDLVDNLRKVVGNENMPTITLTEDAACYVEEVKTKKIKTRKLVLKDFAKKPTHISNPVKYSFYLQEADSSVFSYIRSLTSQMKWEVKIDKGLLVTEFLSGLQLSFGISSRYTANHFQIVKDHTGEIILGGRIKEAEFFNGIMFGSYESRVTSYILGVSSITSGNTLIMITLTCRNEVCFYLKPNPGQPNDLMGKLKEIQGKKHGFYIYANRDGGSITGWGTVVNVDGDELIQVRIPDHVITPSKMEFKYLHDTFLKSKEYGLEQIGPAWIYANMTATI